MTTNGAENIWELVKGSKQLLNLLFTIASITFFWLARYLLLRMIGKYKEDPNVLYRWRKVSSYIIMGLNIIVITQIWIKEFGNILTYLGLLSAGIAIALKEFVLNALGWIYIVSAKPFIVKDRIQIGKMAGDVIDIKAFYFTILEIGNWVDSDQSTGRIVHIPNGQLFTMNLANYTKAFPFIWNELPVMITFDSDWVKAKGILQKILQDKVAHLSKFAEKKVKEAARKYNIFYSTLEPIIYTSVESDGVEFTLRYLCNAKKRRDTTHELWESILEEFARAEGVEFAYRTLTVHSAEK